MIALVPRCWRFGVLAALLPVSGCVRAGSDVLVIASPWNQAERRQIEEDFQRWLAPRRAASPRRIALVWVPFDPANDPPRLLERRRPDVLLGGPVWAYRQLAHADQLMAVDGENPASWLLARRTPIGLAARWTEDSARVQEPRGWSALADPALRGQIALGDPRRDPLALAFAQGRLGTSGWAAGYAELVRSAANAVPMGPARGSARAQWERGEASLTPALVVSGVDARNFITPAKAPYFEEGAALAHAARHPELAQIFLRFLTDHEGARPPRTESQEPDPGVESFLADLLGATLVDAHEELQAAWAALLRAGRPARAERWMTEAPPWPPASILDLSGRGKVEEFQTLAEEVAPDPEVRGWLLELWRRPPRPIDGALFQELAKVSGGKLAAEPRFRAWLRSEWVAWARQRYRRVARLAGEAP
jgi:ABC-type Fe3+ transport system substrate-binding protein